MTSRPAALLLALTGWLAVAPLQPLAQGTTPIIERVGDTGFLQLQAESFKQLTPKQQALAYWLTQASIAIDPIAYDQFSATGIREKRVLEEITGHPQGIPADLFARIRSYALLFWANRGNHNETTSQKFLPSFTSDELTQAALRAQHNGAFKTAYADLPALATADALKTELAALNRSLFDAGFEPTLTAKTPPAGQDILQASSNTFYRGVSLQDLKGFTEKFPLNSRVVKVSGVIREEVYRAGTPDGKIPPGLYATYLQRANEYLEKARALADPEQAKVIAALIRFYQTGEPTDWLRFGADWVRNDATVDFANGFIEVYRDARAAKGSSQSFVTVTDKPVTDAMVALAKNAAYFEERAPWDAKYKKKDFKLPVVKAVEVLIETGDFHVSTIGDNLPNENEIHEMYGTKNFLLLGSSHAMAAASSAKMLQEFTATAEERARGERVGEDSQDMLTAMHEVIGHGSGKLSERLTASGAGAYLKEYSSTLEEARADLMGLWNVWDPKLKELGLVQDQEAVAKSMYDDAARAPLIQLRRIPTGDIINEDHQRNRQLIVNYIIDKTGAIEYVDRDGKKYIRVKDYQKMRDGVGMLLKELMRIKAEGDYQAIKALVDQYGVRFDPKVRDQVVARYKALSQPTYWAGVNPRLTAQFEADGRVKSVTISYPRDAVAQYLEYGKMYAR